MTFVEMRDAIIKHFAEMTADNTQLFTVNLDKDELWETYLNSFTDEQNPIFRVRREYDCRHGRKTCKPSSTHLR